MTELAAFSLSASLRPEKKLILIIVQNEPSTGNSCGLKKLVILQNNNCYSGEKSKILACKQALQGVLAVGWEKGEPATMCLEFEFHLQFPYDSLPTELSAFHQSVCSEKE